MHTPARSNRSSLVVFLLALGLAAGSLVAATNAQPASDEASAAQADEDHHLPAVRRGNAWYLAHDVPATIAPTTFSFGRATDIPLMCDWSGDGTATPAVVRRVNGGLQWFVRFDHDSGVADADFRYGRGGDVPLCGDWNGDGTETPGLFRRTTSGNNFFLSNSFDGGVAHTAFRYGRATDTPVVGDWNGSGTTTIGVVRPADNNLFWLLRNSNSAGNATEAAIRYGRVGDLPVVGDWNGNGNETVGVVRGNQWLLNSTNTPGNADVVFRYGRAGDTPLVWFSAPPAETVISGVVHEATDARPNEYGPRMSGVTVTVTNGVDTTTTTDEQGRYVVTVPQDGTYRLTVQVEGFIPFRQTVSPTGQTETVDFPMYRTAAVPEDSVATDTTGAHVTAVTDFWRIPIVVGSETWSAQDATRIVLERADGVVIELGDAGTTDSWWSRTGTCSSNRVGEQVGDHILYYEFDGTWYSLTATFGSNGGLTHVNGTPYAPCA